MSAMMHASTFWLLMGQFGQTMTITQLRDTYFPGLALNTMQNKGCRGELPKRTGLVYDVRDVAAWWDSKRTEAA